MCFTVTPYDMPIGSKITKHRDFIIRKKMKRIDVEHRLDPISLEKTSTRVPIRYGVIVKREMNMGILDFVFPVTERLE